MELPLNYGETVLQQEQDEIGDEQEKRMIAHVNLKKKKRGGKKGKPAGWTKSK